MALLGTSPTVRALDPERPLTQALLRIWQVPQGLPRAAILSISQTSDGYLWLGTQTGLYRFDGSRFVETTGGVEGLLANRWIQALCADGEGYLWVGTDDNGLFRLQGGVASRVEAERLSQCVHCLLVDRHGELWVGTDDGLGRLGKQGLTVYRTAAGLPLSDIRALSQGPDGTVWIATEGRHLFHWNGSIFETVELQSLPAKATITAIQAGQKDSIWVGSTAGLVHRTIDAERRLTTEDGLGSDLIHCLAPAASGGLWVGSKDGLCRILGDRIEPFQTREGLSQSTVYALCEDHEGSLWVGTKHGLNQFVDRRVLLPFTTSEGLPSNDTGPILQDQANNIWVGTLGSGLARFDGREFSHVATTGDGLPSDRILSLAAGQPSELWVGTDQGLCLQRSGQIVERFTAEHGLPSDVVEALCRDHAGNLWVGTASGLVRREAAEFVAVDASETVQGRRIVALIEDGSHHIVASVAGVGLCRIEDARLIPWSTGLDTTSNVTAFHLDEQRRLWLAIQGQGLGMIAGDRTFQFGVKDGLFDDDIFGITTDEKQQLWMACSRGIFATPLVDLQAFAEGRLSHLTCTPFSPTDALRTIECQQNVQPAICRMQDGRVWFSTIRGVIVIDPDRSVRNLPTPSVLVENVRVNGRDIDPAQVRQLAPGESNLNFHYTALSFTSPTRITFRYRLEGFDPDWIEAGARREAFYTNLPPGDYRFRVKARNADGSWSEAKRPIAFTLQPHFYQSQWFLPALAAVVLGLGWLAYRLRIEQVKGRLQVVLAERSRIARELHDTLLQGFSGVTMQLQALSARLKGSAELDTLQEIIRDAGGCLREARRSVAGLRNRTEPETGLSAAISQAARQLIETSDVKLRLRLASTSNRVHPDVEYNLVRIVQEAIANTLKHAGASHIEVAMQSGKEAIEIVVRDDGAGFDVAEHIDRPRAGHYGVIGMRERAAQLGAELHWQSALRHGTTVTMRLPLALANRPPLKAHKPGVEVA